MIKVDDSLKLPAIRTESKESIDRQYSKQYEGKERPQAPSSITTGIHPSSSLSSQRLCVHRKGGLCVCVRYSSIDETIYLPSKETCALKKKKTEKGCNVVG